MEGLEASEQSSQKHPSNPSTVKILDRKVAISWAERMRVEVSVGIDVASTWNVRRLTIAGNAEEESHF